MKTTLSILISIFLMTALNAQTKSKKVGSSEVPAAVKAAMTKRYPSVTAIDWEKEDANYEAEFEMNEIETSVVFDTQGNLKETETEIAVSGLPKTVTDYVGKNYAHYKITEGAKIVEANGSIMYEAEVKKGTKKFDLIFDSAGAFIRKKD